MASKNTDPAGTKQTDNAVIGRVYTWPQALKAALPIAEQACEAEGTEEKWKADRDKADAEREAAFNKSVNARKELLDEVQMTNRAMFKQDVAQDVVDLAGAAVAVGSILLSGGAALAVGAASSGVGIANDQLRPGPSGSAVVEGAQRSLDVIGIGTAVDPSLARAGAQAAGSLTGAAMGGFSAISTDPGRLQASIANLDELKQFKSTVNDLEPTAIQKYFGADKKKLQELTDKAIAAEEEYQAAYERWVKVENEWEKVQADMGTCITRRQTDIALALFPVK
jgi:hypothetical protein